MSRHLLIVSLAASLAACASDVAAPLDDGGANPATDMRVFDAVAIVDAGDAGLDQALPDAEVLPDAEGAADAEVVLDAEVAPDADPPDQGCNPSPERCNGRDDDCDGEVDEHFNVGAPCGVGVGQCRVTAWIACEADGSAACPAAPTEPTAEACNGLDDDCDGEVDETFDGDGDGAPACAEDVCADCPVGDADVCRALCDAQDCRDENVGVFPGAEDICGDGIDQNCDGRDAPCVEATGRVSTLSIADAMEARCPDVNGDGTPDNALGLLGGLANQPLTDALAGGTLNLFMAASGLGPPGTDGAFALSVLTATAADGVFTVDPSALDPDGRASIRFPTARARAGALRAGPGRFALSLPLAGLALELTLFDARIDSTIAVDEALGLTLGEGVLWGAIRDEDLQAALNGLEATCAEQAADPPSFCGPLAQFRPLLGNLLQMDQDLDQDGVLDGYGACLLLTVDPAQLMGWPAE